MSGPLPLPIPNNAEHHALWHEGVPSPPSAATRDGKGWDGMGREGRALRGHLQHKHSAPWKAPSHGCGAPSCPAPARGHPWVQASPQDTSRHRSSSRAAWPQQGQEAGGAAEASAGLQDQAIKGLIALRISLGSLARRAGGSGWGDARALAPAEDELYSHFHTWASRFPAGGTSATTPALGAARREFWHAAAPSGDGGFFQAGSEGH